MIHTTVDAVNHCSGMYFSRDVNCWQYDIDNDGRLDLLISTTDGQLVFVDAIGKLISSHKVGY